jgi:molybdopterin-dependent oxidoreductase alpha subunit
MSKAKLGRDSWVSLSPNGIGHTKPNHYLEMAKVMWRNRDELPFAWRILTQGVCDGCALGTTGIHDFTLDGVHLCMVRLDLMRLNTMPALDVKHLEDAAKLAKMTAAQLRELGRLPYPMIRRKGEPGFTRISWEEATNITGTRIAQTDPHRMAFYMTSRGLTNESYYVAQKVARFLGTNNIDNASRICHSPSTVALKQTIGVGASTCSYKDWLGTELLIFFGSNTPNNQPVTTKYIYEAKKNGARVIVINPYREPGLERYWIPSVAESAMFGTKIADAFFQVNTGGDQAFIAGVIKYIIENNWTDSQFIKQHTQNFDNLKQSVESFSWEFLEAASGTSSEEMYKFAKMLGEAKSAIFVWSMGITQHRNGVANVRAIADLALTRGFVGRKNCGLVPIRGHSGVQGSAEVGAVPNLFPGGVLVDTAGAEKFKTLYGFEVPDWRGINAVEMIDGAHEGLLDVFYQIGGNFLETLPDPDYVRVAVENIPMRIHQDIVLSPQMMVEPRHTVVLLPAQTRYEQRGGGTETSTERRIIFSPEIKGRRIGQSKPEWEILMLIAEKTWPENAHLIHFDDAQAIRNEIGKAVPSYDGIQNLRKQGDMVQWGGARLCEELDEDGNSIIRFNTDNGLANFYPIKLEEKNPQGKFRLSTRRGKQFNSIVHKQVDPLNGASREDILISLADAQNLNLQNGDTITLRSKVGEWTGRCFIAPITEGNIQVHWPEGNVLLERGDTDPECGIPDYNTLVEIVRRKE